MVFSFFFSPTIEEIRSWGESFDKLMKSNGNLCFTLSCFIIQNTEKNSLNPDKAKTLKLLLTNFLILLYQKISPSVKCWYQIDFYRCYGNYMVAKIGLK